MTDQPTSLTTPAPPGPPSPASKKWRRLLVAGLVAVVAVLVGLFGAMFVDGLVNSSSSGSPGDRAAEYIRAYYDNDGQAALDLIVPAQQRMISEELWEECGFDRIDKVEDGSDPDDPEATIETIEADEEGVFSGSVDGDGRRRYELVSTVVRATSASGRFEEFSVDMVKDGGDWYVRFDDWLLGARQPCA